MSTHHDTMRETWETSFAEQVARQAFNTAPVEALVRSVSYYLRERRQFCLLQVDGDPYRPPDE